jgi:hypothetical protein
MPNLNRDQLLRQEASLREFQARADDALESWNVRAPAPAPDGTLEYGDRYRRKLLRQARDHLPANHKLNITGIDKYMPMDVVETWEQQIYPACKQAGLSNDSAPPGELRMVTRVDPRNNQKMNEFYGDTSFVRGMGRPGRIVRSFRTDHGYVNSSGFPLR